MDNKARVRALASYEALLDSYARARGWVIAGGSVEMLRNRIAVEILGRNFDQRPPKPIVTKE